MLRVLRLVMRFASRALLPANAKGQQVGIEGTTWIVAAGVAVGAALYAFSRDWIAFAIGAVLVVALVAGFLWASRPRRPK